MHRATTRLAALLLCACAAPVCQAQLADLKVEVAGAAAPGGTIEISLFNSAETFMQQPFLQQSGAAGEDGRYTTTFVAVPTGLYAVVVVHDENGNGTFDNGILGVGGEAYGFSNDARPWFGWPDFEEVAVEVDGDLLIDVRLR